MTLLSVWRLLRAVPASLYAGLGACAVFVTAWALHVRAVDSAYLRGQRDTLQGAHFDSVMVKTITDARKAATAHTDTVLRVVTRQVRRVDSIVVADTIRERFPVVDTLVIESKALVVAVDSLTRTLAVERRSTALLVTTLQQSVQDARLMTARLEAETIALRKRPTRIRAVGYALAVGGIGYGMGTR